MEHDRSSGASVRASASEGGRAGVLVFVPEVAPPLQLTLRGILDALRRDRWLYLGTFLVCFGCAVAYALLARPIYRAQVVLLPVSMTEDAGLLSGLQGSGLGSLAGLAGINLDGNDDFRKEALALLTSRDFTVGFIEAEQLLPLLYPKKWDSQARRWRVTGSEVPTVDQALELFDKSVRRVTEDRRNGLVLVSIDWRDRVLAAAWANKLVARANAELRRRTSSDSQRSLEFLRRQLEQTEIVGLQQTLYRLMESELRKITLASVREQYAFRIIDAARVPMVDRPVRPQRALIVLLGFVLAVFACSALLWARAPRGEAANQ
jgi:uncharacterized protein involved in exopolysaccharide biosynthesis